jgi:hypothetical protein
VTPQHLTNNLSKVTCELLSTNETDLGRIEQLLGRRASILAAIADSDPHTFTPADLAMLRTAALDGAAGIEKLTLLYRKTAADWRRLTRLRDSTAQAPDVAIDVQARDPFRLL